jgi:hypothetical protein
MKIVYIAHPVGAVDPVNDFDAFKQVRNNLIHIRRIVRALNLAHQDIVPFAPYVVDCEAMSDWVPAERARGIKNNLALLQSGVVKELWLYGDRISPGMLAEITVADALGIPVVPMTEATKAAIA